MTILYLGIDLAKNVFALHSVNEAGKGDLIRSAVVRDKVDELVASPPHRVVAMWPASARPVELARRRP
jgi:transposase